jgi:hypothetical protein
LEEKELGEEGEEEGYWGNSLGVWVCGIHFGFGVGFGLSALKSVIRF